MVRLSVTQKCLLVCNEIEALELTLMMTSKKMFQKQDHRLHPDLFTDDECKTFFRFHKHDLFELSEALGIPEMNICRGGTKFSGIEGLLILLYRLRYPNRYSDWVRRYGREPSEASVIFNWMLNFVSENHGHLLQSLQLWWLSEEKIQEFARAISSEGSPLARCWGFIDGTVRPICRPKYNQESCYNGHKKVHALKYQSIETPNGLIANLFGPIEGRRHYAFLLSESGVLHELAQLHRGNGHGEPYYLYGDSGYPVREFLISPFRSPLTPENAEFNKSMSSVRVSVEWGFGKMLQQFAFLDFKKNQKLYKQSVGKTYIVAALLTNAHTCLYGSETSTKFSCKPPSLLQYFRNEENA